MIGGTNVVQKTRRVVSRTAQRERAHQRNQKNADRIIPIKKFKAIILHALECIGPRSPADRAGDRHQQRDCKIRWRKHRGSLIWQLVSPRKAGVNRLAFYLYSALVVFRAEAAR